MDRHLSARPPHPLHGAELRAKRAKIHIRSLKQHIQRWTDAHAEYLQVAQRDKNGFIEWSIRADLPIAEVLGRTGIWVGEALYNMRSALDYLVYEIACTCNNQRHVTKTQFPICDDPDDFEAQATGKNSKTGKPATCRLSHVPGPVIDRFRQLQPFSDCQWTRLLRDLSNPDKHRHLHPLTSHAELLPSHHPDLAGLVNQSDEGTIAYHLVVQVFFDQTRLDVIDTLELLQREVRSLVEEFKPAFERIS